MYGRSYGYQSAVGMWGTYEGAYIQGREERARRKSTIGHQRPTCRCTGRCIETNDWVLGLLTTSPPSSVHPSVFLVLPPFLSSPFLTLTPSPLLSLFLFPSYSSRTLSLTAAFLPHSEIPREQTMISNGGALRRRPCSFPFFSVRSSCSSSCGSARSRARRILALPPFFLYHCRSTSGDPLALLSPTTARPPSPFSSARRDRRY